MKEGVESKEKKKAVSSESAGKSATKRKKDSDDLKLSPIATNVESSRPAVSSPSTGTKEPKKFKRAFGFFVKAKRVEAEAQIGDTTVSNVRILLRSHHRHFNFKIFLTGTIFEDFVA